MTCFVLACLLCAGCGGDASGAEEPVPADVPGEEIPMTNEETNMRSINLKIDDTEVSVQWEDNDSVTALKELLEDGPKEVEMSMYGGFEQVGSLGQSLVRHDVQTVTQAGDIVLYSGNSIVVFYGSNSWAYTRLGKITGLTKQELTGLLGNGDVTLTLTLAD